MFINKTLRLSNLKIKALANHANMLANIWANIVGQYVSQHVDAVCYRHEHVGEEKKRQKMLANIY